MTGDRAAWDFTDRNRRILAAATVQGHGCDDGHSSELKTTGVKNMAILTETQTKADAAPSKWAGKVHAGAVVPCWWPSSSTVGVVECTVGDVLRLLVHVNRGKNGRLYANPPSAKRGDQYLPQYEITDPDLAKMVQAVSVQAVEAWQATGGGAAQDDDDDGDLFA